MPADRRLQQALLSAFPGHASLTQMVRFGLGENLDSIVIGNSLSEIVFGLITWAESHGRLEELVTAAKTANPENALLKAFILSSSTRKVFSIPHERNAFFAGREAELQALRDALASHQNAALIQAIRGLGGIGKTQCAVEYAFRCHNAEVGYPTYDYILWTKAETIPDLLAGYRRIAALLPLTPGNLDDQQQVAAEVKQWLETTPNWLLIYDNADDPDLLEPYRPKNAHGHVLLTSRAHRFKGHLGITHPIELHSLLPKDALAFLFHRTDRTVEQEPADERKAAADLAEHLGYFPLALEQAAAYIAAEEITFATYLADFRKRELELLDETPPETGEYYGANAQDYKTVRTTWDFNFRAIEKENPATADLLRFCAFLAPDDIPMLLVIIGATTLGSPLADVFANLQEDGDYIRAYDELLKPLLRYSLIEKKRNDHTFNMHRMVQAVQRTRLGQEQRDWIEQSLQALCKTFPNAEYGNWDQCGSVLPHALSCLEHAQKWPIETEEAALLFNRAGFYLNARGLYFAAESLFKRTLAIRQTTLPSGHPDTANVLSNLARLYNNQGRYEEAEPLYQKALEFYQVALPPGHSDIASSLNNLATLHYKQGRYEEAEPLYKQALEIWQAALPSGHPDIAASLDNLAQLYGQQGRHEEAESLMQQALEFRQVALPAGHPDIAISLNNLAQLYGNQGRYDEAESLHKQALAIMQAALPPGHPDIAASLNNLAQLYCQQGRYEEAESLMQQALEFRQLALPAGHPNIAISLNNLATLYYKQGRHVEAEPLLQQATELVLIALGLQHPDTQLILKNYLLSLSEQGKHEEAEAFARSVGFILKTDAEMI